MSNFPELEYGDENIYVFVLQACLKYWGYQIEITGLFNFNTLDALRKFRKENYLTGDTVCDSATWKKLLEG